MNINAESTVAENMNADKITDNYISFFKKAGFYDFFSEEEKEYFSANISTRKVLKGKPVSEGECLGMIMLISGEIRAYMVSEEGREITLFRVYEGECCALTASCVLSYITFETHVSAEKDCELIILNSRAFARLTESNVNFRCYSYELLIDRFSSAMRSVQQILFDSYVKRLADYLIEELSVAGKNEIEKTQEEIARQTSSAREVVARTLKRLSRAGIINYERGKITVKDIEKLRSFTE